jgi:uncharacterized protein
MTTASGWFLWYEILTDDVAATIAFYSELFGWRTEPYPGSDPPYTVLKVGDRGIGGLMQLPEAARKMGAAAHWLGYLGSADVDATARRATAQGATVVTPPTDIPQVGRWCLLQDPQGVSFALLAPIGPEGTPLASQPGDFSWNELVTSDADAGIRFYTELFGWQRTQTMDMGPLGPYHLFMTHELQGGGVFNKPAEMPAPPHWLYYVQVADLDATVARTARLGGQVLNGPEEVPGGDRVAQCLDSRGAAFGLHWKK